MAGVVVQAAAEEVAKLIRPKEKPRPPGLVRAARAGIRSERRNPTPRYVLSLRRHCKISSL